MANSSEVKERIEDNQEAMKHSGEFEIPKPIYTDESLKTNMLGNHFVCSTPVSQDELKCDTERTALSNDSGFSDCTFKASITETPSLCAPLSAFATRLQPSPEGDSRSSVRSLTNCEFSPINRQSSQSIRGRRLQLNALELSPLQVPVSEQKSQQDKGTHNYLFHDADATKAYETGNVKKEKTSKPKAKNKGSILSQDSGFSLTLRANELEVSLQEMSLEDSFSSSNLRPSLVPERNSTQDLCVPDAEAVPRIGCSGSHTVYCKRSWKNDSSIGRMKEGGSIVASLEIPARGQKSLKCESSGDSSSEQTDNVVSHMRSHECSCFGRFTLTPNYLLHYPCHTSIKTVDTQKVRHTHLCNDHEYPRQITDSGNGMTNSLSGATPHLQHAQSSLNAITPPLHSELSISNSLLEFNARKLDTTAHTNMSYNYYRLKSPNKRAGELDRDDSLLLSPTKSRRTSTVNLNSNAQVKRPVVSSSTRKNVVLDMLGKEEQEDSMSSTLSSAVPSQTDIARLHKIIDKFSPKEPTRLIGRNIGVKKFDIIQRLQQCHFVYCLGKMFQHLSPGDLISFSRVSSCWKAALESDTKAYSRYKQYLRRRKTSAFQHGEGKENCGRKSLEPPSYRLTTSRGHLTSVQSQAEKTHTIGPQTEIQASDPVLSDEQLRLCPHCQGPAVVKPQQDRALCQNKKCTYDFCTCCFASFHYPQPCKPLCKMPSKTEVAGTRKSKKNLKRL